VTPSGSWAERQGLRFRRLCARPGCGTRATATLRFQPTLRQAWLVDLDETTARTQGDLCRRHAATLVLPRGWELHDERTDGPRPIEEPRAEPAPGAPARRVRVRRRRRAPSPEAEPSRLPGFEPVVVPDDMNEDAPALDTEALSTILDARTPLLRRAFRNAQPDEE
jgi:hypothetical protein